MEKLNVKKEILFVLLIVVAIVALSSRVLATGTSASPVQIPGLETNANPSTETAPENTTKQENNAQPENVAKPIDTLGNTTGSTYQNNSLPQTGDASDYAIFAVMAVAAVVAVYAYRKVRNYNI